MATRKQHIRETVVRYVELINAADAGAIAALYAETATLEDPVGTEPVRGSEAIRRFYARVTGEIALELTGEPLVAGGEVAFPMRSRIGGGDPFEIIDVMAFDEDGRISSMRAFWNTE